MSGVLYIINPAGRGGVGMRIWDAFKKLWPDTIDSKNMVVTERPGHARKIALTRDDYEIIAAVGGELFLNIGRLFDPVIDMNPHNNVRILGHDMLLWSARLIETIESGSPKIGCLQMALVGP